MTGAQSKKTPNKTNREAKRQTIINNQHNSTKKSNPISPAISFQIKYLMQNKKIMKKIMIPALLFIFPFATNLQDKYKS